jgi:ubiquinone biosynthesis accessory factor UbiK
MDSFRIDEIARRLLESVPPALLRPMHKDLETNFRAVLRSSLAKLDVVMREEFDTQARVPQRTREQLEGRVPALEAGGSGRQPGGTAACGGGSVRAGGIAAGGGVAGLGCGRTHGDAGAPQSVAGGSAGAGGQTIAGTGATGGGPGANTSGTDRLGTGSGATGRSAH